MPGGEPAQPLRAHPPSAKIKLAQRPGNPDIHRKRRRKAIGEQQHAVGDLFARRRASFINSARASSTRQLPEAFERKLARNDPAGSAQADTARGNPSCMRAIPPRSARPSARPSERQTPALSRRDRYRLTVALAQRADDLPDLHDLLRGGENERCQTFPRVLPQQPQTATRFHRRAQMRIVAGKRGQHRAQVHVGLEKLLEPRPFALRFRGAYRRWLSSDCRRLTQRPPTTPTQLFRIAPRRTPGPRSSSRRDRNRARAGRFHNRAASGSAQIAALEDFHRCARSVPR